MKKPNRAAQYAKVFAGPVPPKTRARGAESALPASPAREPLTDHERGCPGCAAHPLPAVGTPERAHLATLAQLAKLSEVALHHLRVAYRSRCADCGADGDALHHWRCPWWTQGAGADRVPF